MNNVENENSENLQYLINEKFVKLIQELNIQVLKEEDGITTFFLNEVLGKDINNERMLLNFRRVFEVIVKSPLLVTTVSKSTNKIIAVRKDNFLQLLDDRYYEPFQLSSFLDLFKIETNDYKALGIVYEPHLKLIINYIQLHYNTTFRKFMNRNKEYYYMYKFFFDNAEDIKEVLNVLNSYHYSTYKEDKYLYSYTDFNVLRTKITIIYNRLVEVFNGIYEKVRI